MKDFTDTTGFITGGASGIGLAMARALGQRGMRVRIDLRRQPAELATEPTVADVHPLLFFISAGTPG